jgi:hypothetical protein
MTSTLRNFQASKGHSCYKIEKLTTVELYPKEFVMVMYDRLEQYVRTRLRIASMLVGMFTKLEIYSRGYKTIC